MSQHAYHELNYHICWATRNKQPVISRSWRPRLLNILADCVREHKGIPVRQNAMPDHVHLLVKLPPGIIVSRFIESLQTESLERTRAMTGRPREWEWESRFGVVTIRSDDIQKVSGYVDRQESQHKSGRLSEVLERCEEVEQEVRCSFHALYYHFSWATLRRENQLRRSWQPQLLDILAEEVPKREGILIAHNAMPDHVHLLVQLPPLVSVSEFIGAVKGGSAYRVNHEIRAAGALRWQQGFGVVSVREGDLSTVTRYIENQEEHHRKKTLWTIMEKLHAF